MSRKIPYIFMLLTLTALLLVSCATPTPEIIEKVITKEVEKVITQVVKETIIVKATPEVVKKEITRIVEKEVVQTVEVEKMVVVEKVVTATPLPPGSDKRGGTIVMAFYQEPDTLNPHICDDELSNRVLQLALLLEDVHVIHGLGSISTAHTETDISLVEQAYGRVAKRIKASL